MEMYRSAEVNMDVI